MKLFSLVCYLRLFLLSLLFPAHFSNHFLSYYFIFHFLLYYIYYIYLLYLFFIFIGSFTFDLFRLLNETTEESSTSASIVSLMSILFYDLYLVFKSGFFIFFLQSRWETYKLNMCMYRDDACTCVYQWKSRVWCVTALQVHCILFLCPLSGLLCTILALSLGYTGLPYNSSFLHQPVHCPSWNFSMHFWPLSCKGFSNLAAVLVCSFVIRILCKGDKG